MSRSASSGGGGPEPRFAVVGNPDNRRVSFFEEAVRAAGLPAARVVPWLQVLSGDAAFAPGESVRIDSPGEDAEVDRLLRGVDDPTRVEGTARWYARFTAAAEAVAGAASAAGAEVLGSPPISPFSSTSGCATGCSTGRGSPCPLRRPPDRRRPRCAAGPTYGSCCVSTGCRGRS